MGNETGEHAGNETGEHAGNETDVVVCSDESDEEGDVMLACKIPTMST